MITAIYEEKERETEEESFQIPQVSDKETDLCSGVKPTQ